MDTTIEDFSKYSDDELVEMYHEAKHLSFIYDIFQLAKKILLNSLYGAVGNNFFRYYDRDMARSITLMGQCMINKAAILKNKFISKFLGEDTVKDRRIYSDTDSVVGSTKITVRDSSDKVETIPIETFYKRLFLSEEEYTDGKHIKHVFGYDVSTVNDSKEDFTEIEYAMKHKVSKRMFKVTVDGKEVEITEDHSIMVMRDGKLIECSPKDIIDGDQLIISDDNI